MALAYTNVELVKVGVTTLLNVTSLSVNQTSPPLEGQSDGARSPSAIGTLGTSFDVTIEGEETGQDLEALKADCTGEDLVFKAQEACDPAALLTFTLTDVIVLDINRATSQDSPNTWTMTLRNLTPLSAISSA